MAGAKRAAATEPLFISDRGEPTFALLSIEKFQQLTRSGKSALDTLVELGAQFAIGELNFEWEPERVAGRPRDPQFETCGVPARLQRRIRNEAHHAGHGNRQVVRWLEQFEDSALCLSAITVLELELGCLLMDRRDTSQGTVLRRCMCRTYVDLTTR